MLLTFAIFVGNASGPNNLTCPRLKPIISMTTPSKIIVGSEEWCAFPELGIPAIKARVDSGAKTSSVHAFNIQRFRRNGELWVSFEVHPLQDNRRAAVRCERPVVDKRGVKSSSGAAETRYVVVTQLQIGPHRWDAEVTLSNRDSMGYRMLLGREAMVGRVIVDPALSFCLGEVAAATLHDYYGRLAREKSGLTIGLLASDPEQYSHRRLLEAGEERGHEMKFLDVRHCYFKSSTHHPEVRYRGKEVADLDAALVYVRSSWAAYGGTVARQLTSGGAVIINPADAVAHFRDGSVLPRLAKAGVAIPATGFAHATADTGDLIDLMGGLPLIVKLPEETSGPKTLRLETKATAERTINLLRSAGGSPLVQEYIREAEEKTRRLLVVDGKVVAAVQRTASSDALGTTAAPKATVSVVRATPDERALAVKAAKVLGLTVAEVTIVRAKTGSLVLAIDPTPDLKSIEKATGKDIARIIISAVEKKLKWEREIAPGAP